MSQISLYYSSFSFLNYRYFLHLNHLGNKPGNYLLTFIMFQSLFLQVPAFVFFHLLFMCSVSTPQLMLQFRLSFSLLSTIVIFSNLIPMPPNLLFSIYLYHSCQSDFSKKQDYLITPLFNNLQWIIVSYKMKPKLLYIMPGLS